MSDDVRQILATELSADLGRAIEAMTGERPALRLGSDSPGDTPALTWRQRFGGSSGAAWLTAAPNVWVSLGARTLRAAGIDDGDQETSKSTFVEVLSQAFSMFGRSVSERTGAELNPIEGAETGDLPSAEWTLVQLSFQDGGSESLFVAFEDALARDVAAAPAPALAATTPPDVARRLAISHPAAENSKTLDLLLDVELPVSVSFGRAQLPLRDVVKLTTGSIVELNRTIGEPVEVIVNNCVIARGEVVVVEGNYGVRIHQVVSKEERLRTLY